MNTPNLARLGAIQNDAVSKQWMKTKNLEEEYGIPKATWVYWRATGEGPRYCKLSRTVLYDRRDVESWLQARKIRSTSDQYQ